MQTESLDRSREIIAQMLKARREQLQLSETDLAVQLGWKPQTIEKIEAGKFWPPMAQFMALLQILNLDMYLTAFHKSDYLLTSEQEHIFPVNR